MTETQSRQSDTDWSKAIAKILFGKAESKLGIASEAELESLVAQAKANKALARTLVQVEGLTNRIERLLDGIRHEVADQLDDSLRLLTDAQTICMEMGVPFAVLKSFDALPDVGHDIDLLVGRNLRNVRSMILKRFNCSAVTLTFCDRQAGKFSTFVQGFHSDLELYTRFSQLGEEYVPVDQVLERRVSFQLAEGFTYLCCQEDRLIITCIHTLYRHGRIRLSDLGIAYESLKAGLDVRKILETVESAGVSRGFAVFITILDRTFKEMIGEDPIPFPIRSYVNRILAGDRVLALLMDMMERRFPLKVPVLITALLFLYKGASDLSQSCVQSGLRSLTAPFLLALDKVVPLRFQKAIRVRIW